MSQPAKALLEDRPLNLNPAAPDRREVPSDAAAGRIRLTISEDIEALGDTWRRFEQAADATAFQSFAWLSLWHRHVGAPQGVRAAIVLGHGEDGELKFLIPLGVSSGAIRHLTFLGSSLSDYNAPLLVPGFAAAMTREAFLALWAEIRAELQRRPEFRHDIIELTKMPTTVGDQPNPFLHLDATLNPSGAHLTHLSGTWDEFYTAKRSSATRRRDRTKRKRLGEFGEVRYVEPEEAGALTQTLTTLFEQKGRAFARMGVQNLFAPPGNREFFLALATDPVARGLVHVSRLDVGSTMAAVNLGLRFHGSYYHVLASYDEGDVSRFGPGAAHLRDLLQHAIEKGLTRFDFTIGDERYKLEWSDTLVTLYDHVSAASLKGWPLVAPSKAFWRVKRFIKQTPVLWAAFTAMRAAVAKLRGQKPAEAEDAGEATGDAAPTQKRSPPIAPE
jgi:CelD/BcsL family acetyltransferase involved in cellulose biosynthesis